MLECLNERIHGCTNRRGGACAVVSNSIRHCSEPVRFRLGIGTGFKFVDAVPVSGIRTCKPIRRREPSNTSTEDVTQPSGAAHAYCGSRSCPTYSGARLGTGRLPSSKRIKFNASNGALTFMSLSK